MSADLLIAEAWNSASSVAMAVLPLAVLFLGFQLLLLRLPGRSFRKIVAGTLLPFSGRLVDNQGRVRLERGALDDASIASMDWFVEGVVGSVPMR